MKPYKKTSLRATLMVLALGVTSPLAASADECKSLWIERNQIFKNQGYCFGSALGKGYFGNSGCTTKSPSLSSSQQNRVAAIKRREGQLNCAAKKKNWSVASLRNNSSGGTRSTSNSSSEPTGGGLLGAMLRGGIRAIENAGNSSGSSSGTYTDSTSSSSSSSSSSKPQKGIANISRSGRYTIIQCVDGRKRKVHHNSYGECEMPSNFGAYPCDYAIERTKKSCF